MNIQEFLTNKNSYQIIVEEPKEAIDLNNNIKEEVIEFEVDLDDDLLTYCKSMKRKLRGDWDNVNAISGVKEGCLTGDAIIRTNRTELGRQYSLKYMYNALNGNPDRIKHLRGWDKSLPTYIRSFNDYRIKLHKIKRIVYTGKKEVFELQLGDGKRIKATRDHKFLTKDGWKELQNLTIKDSIMCDNPNTSKLYKIRHKFHDIQICRLFYHPYAKPFIDNKPKRIEVHRLIYEAYLNNLNFLEYIDILSNDKEKSKTLKFVNPKLYAVHHKDGNHYNNSKENLECLPKEEHQKLHGNYLYTNFNQGIPIYVKIKDKKYVGIEDTYDIECEEPYHNFVANDIIVHNCGKTTLGIIQGYLIDRNFDLIKNIAYIPDATQISRQFNELPKYSYFLIDEAIKALYKLGWYSLVQQSIVKMYATERYQNKCSCVIIPRFRDLTENFRNHKVQYWFHVITRGYGVCFVRDEDKDVKDPWHFDENLKYKTKFSRGAIRNLTLRKVITAEKRTKNYLFDFSFPQLPDKIENVYKKLRNTSRKWQSDDSEILKPRQKQWLEQRNKLIAYLKERFGEDISDSEIKNVLRSNEDIDKLVQEAKEKQRKKRSIIGITRDIPEDKFTKFHEWEEKGET